MRKIQVLCVGISILFGGLAIVNGAALVAHNFRQSARATTEQKIVTIYDQTSRQTVLTTAKTVQQVLKEAEIEVGKDDLVEPGLATEVSDGFFINIFRAKPLTIVDGERRFKIMTPYKLAADIIKGVGMEFYPEDEAEFVVDQLDLGAGVGTKLIIQRATAFELTFFGKNSLVRTQAKTVDEFLSQKKIKLGANDRINLDKNSKITTDMKLEIWQEGEQEISQEEEVEFKVRSVKNYEKPVGFKKIQQTGKKGKRLVTYKIEIRNKQEVARTELKSVTIEEAVEQVEVIGAKSSGGLTRSKGVNNYLDSKGVLHRETYYDLPMSVVMRNCGAGGRYTVREDGVKVDAAGYVLVAAHLGNYPRCSIVETSLGLGKVYDTGTFTSTHPHGFDLATDWTKRDGI